MSRRRGRKSRTPWRRHLRDLLDYEALWTALAVLAIIAVIAPQVDLRLREYAPGDIAVADITTPIDLEVRDPVSTESRRSEAVDLVPDVYDYNPTAWESTRSVLRSLFEWGRQVRGTTERDWEALDEPRRAALVETAGEVAGRQITGRLLATLWDQPGGFSVATELRVAGAIQSILEDRYVGGIEPTRADGGTSIIVRNIANQREQRLGDLSTILDVDRARHQVSDMTVALLTSDGEDEAGESPEVIFSTAAAEVVGGLAAQLLRPNLTYNSNETEMRRQEAYVGVPPVFYQVKRGRTLLRAGDEVTSRTVLELAALRDQLNTDRSALSTAGTAFLVALAVIAMWRYAVHYRRRFRFQKVRRLYLMMLVVLVGSVLLTRLSLFVADAVASSLTSEPFNVAEAYHYAVPLAAGGLLLLLLVDLQIAWAFSAIFAVVVAVMTQSLPLTVFTLLSSFAAIYGMSQYKQRTALVQAGLLVGGANAAAVLGLALLAQPPASWSIIAFGSACALAGGILVSMVVTTAIPPLEHCFQCMTDIKLLELSNMNLPLLKELAVGAPGTYHHSVVVGTLAEKAAETIGVNPLFTRVAAYYHDIGKLRQPEYFIENQRDGHNPHEKLTPHMSALVLVSHVKEGVAYAEEHGLPQPLVDMISQHHGTRLIAFFYEKARQQGAAGNSEVNPEEFRYPGPRPQSKEAAILMLADSVEATSRTLNDPSPSRLRTMIRRTIQDVVDDDQLSECGLTLADLARIGDAFLGVLAGMHHQRVEYPSSEDADEVDVAFADEDRGPELPRQAYH